MATSFAVGNWQVQVKKERSNLVRAGKHPINGTTAVFATSAARPPTKPVPPTPRSRQFTTPPVSPYYSPRRKEDAFPSRSDNNGDGSSLASGAAWSSFECGDGSSVGGDNGSSSIASAAGIGNPVLEAEAYRLEALRRRRFVELQQMLAFELRGLAREERDRQLAEKARAREAMAERKRAKMFEAADRARLARERSWQDREKISEREAAARRVVEDEAARRFDEQDRLRRTQAKLAAERRAELAAQKAALLQGRIDRGARVRRARQLRTERLAAQKAAERDAAAETAKRVRDSEHEARKAAAAERWAAARAGVDVARRRRDAEAKALREKAGGRIAALEDRVASFRIRQKEIEERERELREEEAAELNRARHEAARRKIEGDAKRKADEVEGKVLREKRVAQQREIKKEREAARRKAEMREKEELRDRMMERKAKADKERREAIRLKLEQDDAKVELLRLEKERLRATRGKLSSETTKQRKMLQGHFEALKEYSNGHSISYGELAAAVTAAGAGATAAAPAAAAEPGGDRNCLGGANPAAAAARRPNATTPRAVRPSGPHHRADMSVARGGGADSLFPAPHSGSPRFPPPAQNDIKTGARARAAPRPPPGPTSSASVASITTSLSLLVRDGSHGGGGGGKTPPLTARATAHRRISPRKPSTSAGDRRGGSGSGDHRGARVDNPAAAGLREWYMYDTREGQKLVGRGSARGGTRTATASKAKTPRGRKNRLVKAKETAAGGLGHGRGGTTSSASETGRENRRPETGRRPLAEASDELESGSDDFEAYASMSSSYSTDANSTTNTTTPSPPLPSSRPSSPRGEPGASSSDADLLRGRYDRELLAVLAEEQAAEGAREKALAAAVARAKAAQARAGYVGGKRSSAAATGGQIKDGGCPESQGVSPMSGGEPDGVVATTARLAIAAAPGEGGGGGAVRGDGQDRREEEAAVATRDAIRLEKELATERREASERVLRVSEAYEEALRKLSCDRQCSPPSLAVSRRDADRDAQ
ncbi:hypothetical protein Esi_0341_0021 [Ectocarpus siliculosus]|uniref:Uncharacterized protein n=1 Tax=Ectocarpus siliculosus TaxID=2880 RepID=D7FYC8_ECTSI|nr:hypothetical protein Esi_0341_0021 [Ectocarpus siliculosus]|eukprot:CBJ32470.1 hypothetical protein Esi_0341_0021 [Ectocarpus siliculosus]